MIKTPLWLNLLLGTIGIGILYLLIRNTMTKNGQKDLFSRSRNADKIDWRMPDEKKKDKKDKKEE